MSALTDYIQQARPTSVREALHWITQPRYGVPVQGTRPRSAWPRFKRRHARRLALDAGITRADLADPNAIHDRIIAYLQSAAPADRLLALYRAPLLREVAEAKADAWLAEDDAAEPHTTVPELPPLWKQWGLSAPPTESEVRAAMKQARGATQ